MIHGSTDSQSEVKYLKSRGFQNRRSRIARIKIDSDLEDKYPHNISFYLDPPTESISLKEFEDYAIARLKVLRVIERINLTSNKKYSLDWQSAIDAGIRNLKIGEFVNVVQENVNDLEVQLESRKYDVISHFILRLAYCRTEDLRKWFIAQELDFFRYRFAKLNKSSMTKLLKLNNMEFTKISAELKEEILSDLKNGTQFFSKEFVINADFYQVPFFTVLELVRGRKVYLRKGMAFIPHSEINSIVSTQFRKTLSHCIALTVKVLPEIYEDERLCQLLTNFDKRYTGKGFEGKKENENSITMEELPTLSKTSFPLCMSNLYNVVEKENHLKHFGRLQLGLFLKGAGLSLEEATKFWRHFFTKKAGMDGNRFDKQYLYNIRHMYGKEGKRADYTPYSCMKVIMSTVGPGDHHGCPFRHSDQASLRSKLVGLKVPTENINQILKLVEGHHYQVACQKYFEFTHTNTTLEEGIQHPNQYFEESLNVNLGRTRKIKDKIATTKVSLYSNGSDTPSESQVNETQSTLIGTNSENEISSNEHADDTFMFTEEFSEDFETEIENSNEINSEISPIDSEEKEPEKMEEA